MSTNSITPILPGGNIGMLGGGQLGRMSIMAGRHMGYRFKVFEPKPGGAAGMVADSQTNQPYDNLDALLQFAQSVDRISLEFENIPLEAIEAMAPYTAVYPRGEVLHICQNRRREKQFLSEHNFPCAAHRVVTSANELKQAVDELGTPCVLKTADFGYDGKGQVKIETPDIDFEATWSKLGYDCGVLEEWVDYELEFSVIVAANGRGDIGSFPLTENIHRNHILHMSIAPARVPEAVAHAAQSLANNIAEAFNFVGLLAIEMFLTKSGEIIVNEMAPRPHNSGHWTIDGCATSQFEQHIRAVCGMPLGSTDILCPSVMVNILGDAWRDGQSPDWNALLAIPNLKLHLYDKGEPRVGRKMGHFTLIGENLEQVVSAAEKAYTLL